ncbi:MAG: M67 family metallopeptidase [Planctomycetota bacterium]
MRIVVDVEQLGRAVTASRVALPAEACGLMLGSTDDDGTVRVARVVPTRNAATTAREDRFEVHPEDYVRLDGEARELGLEIVGVWHSHPDSGARPSRTDRDGALPGWSYLIVGRAAHGDLHVRSWRLEDEVFVEESLVTTEEEGAVVPGVERRSASIESQRPDVAIAS